MDKGRPSAEAVAVYGNRISAVGTSAEARAGTISNPSMVRSRNFGESERFLILPLLFRTAHWTRFNNQGASGWERRAAERARDTEFTSWIR
jgi:hypothetical protein